jgi:hypothetical protein
MNIGERFRRKISFLVKFLTRQKKAAAKEIGVAATLVRSLL